MLYNRLRSVCLRSRLLQHLPARFGFCLLDLTLVHLSGRFLDLDLGKHSTSALCLDFRSLLRYQPVSKLVPDVDVVPSRVMAARSRRSPANL